MRKQPLYLLVILLFAGGYQACHSPEASLWESDALCWYPDRIVGEEGGLQALSAKEIIITTQDQTCERWRQQPAVAAYPAYSVSHLLEQAFYHLAMEEMAVRMKAEEMQPYELFESREHGEIDYELIRAVACFRPQVAMSCLMKQVSADQTLHCGPADSSLPSCSLQWIPVAWDLYNSTGNQEWLRMIYPIVNNSLQASPPQAFEAMEKELWEVAAQMASILSHVDDESAFRQRVGAVAASDRRSQPVDEEQLMHRMLAVYEAVIQSASTKNRSSGIIVEGAYRQLNLIVRELFGITFLSDRLQFSPVVPEAIAAVRRLQGFTYRKAILDIQLEGHGTRISSFTINGKEHAPYIPADYSGRQSIRIVMKGEG